MGTGLLIPALCADLAAVRLRGWRSRRRCPTPAPMQGRTSCCGPAVAKALRVGSRTHEPRVGTGAELGVGEPAGWSHRSCRRQRGARLQAGGRLVDGRAGRCAWSPPSARRKAWVPIAFLLWVVPGDTRQPASPLPVPLSPFTPPSSAPPPPLPSLTTLPTLPGPGRARAGDSRYRVPRRERARTLFCALQGSVRVAGLGQARRLLAGRGAGPATERSTALLPALGTASLPGLRLPQLRPLAPGAQARGGSWEEAEASVSPLLGGTAAPWGRLGGRTPSWQQPSEPCLPFRSHRRQPGALRHENPGARGSHRHHNPPAPRQPGDQARLPQRHGVPDRDHPEHGLVSAAGDGVRGSCCRAGGWGPSPASCLGPPSPLTGCFSSPFGRDPNGFADWTFSTVRCWGEEAQGTYRLVVRDIGESCHPWVPRGAAAAALCHGLGSCQLHTRAAAQSGGEFHAGAAHFPPRR